VKKPEDVLREAFLVQMPHALPHVRLFYRNIIDRHVIDPRTHREYQLKSGSPGMADLYGHARASPWPIPIEIELKTWDGRQSKEQRAWQAFTTMMKIPYLLLRQKKGETTDQTVSRWIQEVKALLTSIQAEIPPSTTTHWTTSSTDCLPGAPLSAPTSVTPSG
jgi:hypothetical protein